MKSHIDTQSTLTGLQKAIEAELVKAAEPLIQKAVADFEKEARRQVGLRCIALLESSYDARQHGQTLVIRIGGMFSDNQTPFV